MVPEFVITIYKHRVLGNILAPYFIEKVDNKEFYRTIERASPEAEEIPDNSIRENIIQLIKLIEDYDDPKLISMFAKKTGKIKSAQDFFTPENHETIEKFVIPYVEKKIAKCLDILLECKVIGMPVKLFEMKSPKIIHGEDEIEITTEITNCTFNFNKTEEGIRYHLSIEYDDKELKLTGEKAQIIVNDPCRMILNGKLYFFEDINGKKLKPFFAKPFVLIPARTEKKYFETFIYNSVKNNKVKATGFAIKEIDVDPLPVLSVEYNLRGQPVIILRIRYENKEFAYNRGESISVNVKEENEGLVFYRLKRNQKKENIFAEQLKKNGLINTGNSEFTPEISSKDSSESCHNLINWLSEHSDSLKKMNFQMNQKLKEKNYSLRKASLHMITRLKNDWFDIEAAVFIGEFEIPFSKFRKNIISGNREYILPDNSIFVLPEEWFADYQDLMVFSKTDNADSLRLGTQHFQIVNPKKFGISKSFIEKFNQVNDLSETNILPPVQLEANLRPYQISGFSFLYQLFRNDLNGCLADDMGLGKTVQTLALLLKTKEQKQNEQKKETGEFIQLNLFDSVSESEKVNEPQYPSLIVCPTSVVHNWENEIQKFAPVLKYKIHTGTNRTSDFTDLKNNDLIIASYGIVRNDINWLKNNVFHYVVLDESQYIKNPESKAYKAMLELQCRHRLVLTGTPIENSLRDLWSQMNFLNRGMLGTREYFKENYIRPIEKNNNEEKQKRLKKLIRPFILRRTKGEVEKDLPALTEQILFCDMEESQGKIYEEEKSKTRNAILELQTSKKLHTQTFFVLQSLTKLRLIASHPKMTDPDYSGNSGKFEEIINLLDTLSSENHKVLVFSSFVKHLVLIETFLMEIGRPYSMLTGASKNRKEIIDKFQEDEKNNIFLISIKAGGTGLNLTSADYVFILDPWWNPAVEKQAISRAHRIGQNKKVFVYRFITKDTVEEKIYRLQQKKTELAETFIHSNNPFSSLKDEEMLGLFE